MDALSRTVRHDGRRGLFAYGVSRVLIGPVSIIISTTLPGPARGLPRRHRRLKRFPPAIRAAGAFM